MRPGPEEAPVQIAVRKAFQALALTTAVALSGCQEFKGVNTFAARSETASAAGSLPKMSIRQAQAIHDQLFEKVTDEVNDQAIHRARAEARPTIERILGIAGCSPDPDITRYLTPFSTPDASNQRSPMARMKYHPRSQCLTVVHVYGWRIPTDNALSFRAVFLSDLTREISMMQYDMVKQADGGWLLRECARISQGTRR
jgi:hypothetical protein